LPLSSSSVVVLVRRLASTTSDSSFLLLLPASSSSPDANAAPLTNTICAIKRKKRRAKRGEINANFLRRFFGRNATSRLQYSVIIFSTPFFVSSGDFSYKNFYINQVFCVSFYLSDSLRVCGGLYVCITNVSLFPNLTEEQRCSRRLSGRTLFRDSERTVR